METALTVFFGLLGLGIIVFIHEAGHFIAAKLCGVGVTTFSLGWGKKLAGFKHKGTMYQISWIPIGGYCKMQGEMQAPENLDKEKFHDMLHEPGSYLAAKWWKKVIIAVAGPMANIIFAVLIFTIIGVVGHTVQSAENRIILADLSGPDTPARRAGLETGDRILEINGSPVTYFEQLSSVVRKSAGKELLLGVERDGKLFDTILIPEFYKGRGMMGVYGWAESTITNVEKNSLADKAGIQVGDRIVKANNTPVSLYSDLDPILTEKPEHLELTLSRESTLFTTVIPLNYESKKGINLGLDCFKQYRTPKMNLGEAFTGGLVQCGEIVDLTIKGFAMLFRGNQEDLKDAVAGPIRITQMVGQVTILGFKLGISEGFLAFFQLICILCVIVAFMNMLPIPALDGGQVVLSIYMQVVKNRLTPKFLYRYQFIGFFIVCILLTIAVFSDIFNLIG